MAYGIEVYNSSGGVTLSTLDRLYRLYAVYSYNFPASTGPTSAFQTLNITCAPLVDDGTWKIYVGSANHDAGIRTGFFTVKLMYLDYAANQPVYQYDTLAGEAYVFQI